MSALIDVQEENDVVWTMRHGVLRAWQVQDGELVEVDPVEALRDLGGRLAALPGPTNAAALP